MQDTETPNNKMYVLVRGDLPTGAQLAQSIHASVELTLMAPEAVSVTPTVVVLEVADEEELLGWFQCFSQGAHPDLAINGPMALFREPDLVGHPGGSFTALASICDGRRFANLPLAGGGKV